MRPADFDRCLAEAYRNAAYSPDPSNQNGAVIYQGFTKLGEGFNHFYPGIEPNVDDRRLKYERIVHAEADACFSLARCSISITDQAVMLCPWATCKPCAIALLGSGVRRLVIHKERCETFIKTRAAQEGGETANHKAVWQPDIDESFQWLKNGGVEIIIFEGPVTQYRGGGIIINGRTWNPATLEFTE